MDFRYSEEQLALQDTLQRFISRDYDFERPKLQLEATAPAIGLSNIGDLSVLKKCSRDGSVRCE